MIKHLAALILSLLMFSTIAKAQNRANIKGHVVDSLNNEALEFATVAVLDAKDSSLVSYTTTLKTGDFSLHNLPADKQLKLVITFVSCKNYRRILLLKKGEMLDLGTIKMARKEGGMLGEISIKSEASPIVVKKDTIEFSAEAFKTPPNAVIEELLKRLPGIQVDMDGTITMNGKKVNKLLIDGKQFFVNDPKIASRNLDAALIDKVQVYDDRENDPDHLIPDSKVEKIINLKFKSKLKKSTFGKLRGGGGTEDRFDGGLLYNMFRDTLQISLIGIGNNLNKTGFSTQDLISQGGFNRSGSDGLYGGGGIATGGRSYGGIQTVGSGGVNINTDYGKKLKLNLLYFYSYTSDQYKSAAVNNRLLGDTTFISIGNSTSKNRSGKHSISGLIEWKPDTIVKLRYVPSLNFNNNNSERGSDGFNSSTVAPKLSSSINSSNNDGNSLRFQQSFSYYRKLRKKGESLNFTHSLNISPGTSRNFSDNDFTSYTSQLPSSDLHRLGDNLNNSADVSFGLTYRHPFTKKWIGSVDLRGNYNFNHGRLFTYDQDLKTGQYNIYIDSLSRDLRRNQFTETARPELTYKIADRSSLVVSLGMQWIQIYDQFHKGIPDVDRHNFYLLPALRFDGDSYSLSYDVSISQPSINDLLPYTTFYSQLYSSVGNPDLKPSRTHNISFNVYKYKSESQVNFNLYSYLSIEENSVFTQENITSQNATISRPINRDGRYNMYAGANFGKGFKKIGNWQIRLNTGLTASYYHNFFQVNSVQGYQNTTSFNYNQSFFINWNNKLEFNPSYRLSPSITTYKDVPYSNVSYATHSLDVPIIVRPIKRLSIEANYTYTYNPLVSAGFQKSVNLFNIAIARQIQKRDRGEIRLSCYDLFDQNVSAYRYVNGNNTYDVQNQILKRYLLLTYAYRFSNVVTAPKKKPQ